MKITDVVNTVGKSISDAVDYVVDKNRTRAQISRVKLIIKHESDFITRKYIELGKYYYENLRNTGFEENERRCDEIEIAFKNIEKARLRYEEILNKSAGCCDCTCGGHNCEKAESDKCSEDQSDEDSYIDDEDRLLEAEAFIKKLFEENPPMLSEELCDELSEEKPKKTIKMVVKKSEAMHEDSESKKPEQSDTEEADSEAADIE